MRDFSREEHLESASTADTEKIGADLAECLLADPALPRFIALYGDLGVGKTAFVRGFTSVTVPGAPVRSPTFTLVNEYRAGGAVPVFHFDMYRIGDEDELDSIGFYDYLAQPGFFLVEWSEQIPFALPDERLSVTIEKDPTGADESRRLITIRRQG